MVKGEGERIQRERGRESALLSTVSLPRCLQRSWLGQVKTGSQHSSMGGRNPSPSTHVLAGCSIRRTEWPGLKAVNPMWDAGAACRELICVLWYLPQINIQVPLQLGFFRLFKDSFSNVNAILCYFIVNLNILYWQNNGCIYKIINIYTNKAISVLVTKCCSIFSSSYNFTKFSEAVLWHSR